MNSGAIELGENAQLLSKFALGLCPGSGRIGWDGHAKGVDLGTNAKAIASAPNGSIVVHSREGNMEIPASNNPNVPLAYLLPLTELLICLTLAVVAIPNLGHQIGSSFDPKVRSLVAGSEPRHKVPTIGKHQPWDVSVCQLIWLTNMPGMWAELVTSTHTWPYSWFPAGFSDLDSWRALFWPFAALPFWFSGGKGIDYFLDRSHSQQKIGWITLVIAVLNIGYGAILIPLGVSDDNSDVRPPAFDHAMSVLGGIWFILGSMCCAAWILQFLKKRRLRKAQNA